MKTIIQYAMIAMMAAALLGASAVVTKAFADGNHHDECDSSDQPPFKDFPDASGPTGNPHTCQQPTGDPHLDEDNPESGNPHNT